LKEGDTRLSAILLKSQTLRALDALQAPADIIEARRVMGFELRAFFKIGIGFRFAAEHQIGQAAEIVCPRIIGAALDGLRKFFVCALVISRQVRVHPVAIVLRKNRLIINRQRNTAQRKTAER